MGAVGGACGGVVLPWAARCFAGRRSASLGGAVLRWAAGEWVLWVDSMLEGVRTCRRGVLISR